MNSVFAFLAPLAVLLPAIAGERQGAAPEEETARQVRIEERVIIRIAPSSPASSERMLSLLPRRPSARATFQEEKLDGCVPVAATDPLYILYTSGSGDCRRPARRAEPPAAVHARPQDSQRGARTDLQC